MRRHDLDLVSLITGLVFVGIAVGHILDEASDFDLNGRWIVPVVLVALGVAGLAGLLRPKDQAGQDVPDEDRLPAAPEAPDAPDVADDEEAAAR